MPEWRRAGPRDLSALVALEALCYDPPRRQSVSSLRRSLRSPMQTVLVAEDGAGLTAALVRWDHPQTVRIYGVHVRPDLQGRGLGRALVLEAERHAVATGRRRVVLEAAASDERLLRWYDQQGYRRTARKNDFYGRGHHAWRLEKVVSAHRD